jgi:O-antigen/teichoic acid export membrane protein
MGRFRLPWTTPEASGVSSTREADSVGDVARGAALLFVAQVVGNIGFFAAVLVLARALSTAERGTIAFMIVTAFIAARTTRIGLNEATTIFAAQRPAQRSHLLSNLLLWSTLGSAAAGALVAAVLLALGSHRPAGLSAADAMMVGAGIVAIAFFEAGNGFLTGCSRYREKAVALLWAPWAYAAMLCVAQFTVGLSVVLAAAVWVLAHVIWGIAVWVPSMRIAGLGRPDWPLFRESIRFGTRAWVGTLSDFLNFRTDQLLMGFLATQTALGIYAVAVNASEVLLYLPDAVGVALLPFLARGGSRRVGDTLLTFRRLAAVTVATLVVAALVAPPLIPLIFGHAYDQSVVPFLLLLPGAIGFAALRVFSYGMLGSNAPGRSSIAPVVSLVSGVTLDFLLIPPFGAGGAAAAASTAFLLGGITAMVLYRVNQPFRLVELLPRPRDLGLRELVPFVSPVALRAFYPTRAALVRTRSIAGKPQRGSAFCSITGSRTIAMSSLCGPSGSGARCSFLRRRGIEPSVLPRRPRCSSGARTMANSSRSHSMTASGTSPTMRCPCWRSSGFKRPSS